MECGTGYWPLIGDTNFADQWRSLDRYSSLVHSGHVFRSYESKTNFVSSDLWGCSAPSTRNRGEGNPCVYKIAPNIVRDVLDPQKHILYLFYGHGGLASHSKRTAFRLRVIFLNETVHHLLKHRSTNRPLHDLWIRCTYRCNLYGLGVCTSTYEYLVTQLNYLPPKLVWPE
jgi:hypothetical protein